MSSLHMKTYKIYYCFKLYSVFNLEKVNKINQNINLTLGKLLTIFILLKNSS